MSLTLLSLLGIILYLSYKFFTRNHNYWKHRNVFCFKPIPLFGNLLDVVLFRCYMGEAIGKLYSSTKEPFLGMYAFNTPILIVNDPELIKHVLIKDFKFFDNRSIATSKHDALTSHTLFFERNPEWRIMRNKMSPLHTTGKLKLMLPLISNCGKSFTKYLDRNCFQSSMDAKELCAKYTTEVISRCAFGITANSFENENAEFRQAGRRMFDFTVPNAFRSFSYLFAPQLVELFKLTFLDPLSLDFLKKAFWDTLRQRESSGEKGSDVIDAIIAIKNSEDFRKDVPDFEGDKVMAQALIFFAAGFETSSTIMAFTLYELSLQPQIQQKVRDEIKRTKEEYGSLTYEAILSMKYLQMCVAETLRKYPVLPFLDRRCNEDYKIPESEVVIEKGTSVYIPLFGLHYDPQYFPDPDRYDPERFSVENIGKIHPLTYLPFGEGPRGCMGERFGYLSTKSGLCHVLSEFLVEKSAKTPEKIDLEPKTFVIIAKAGVPLHFRKLSDKAVNGF